MRQHLFPNTSPAVQAGQPTWPRAVSSAQCQVTGGPQEEWPFLEAQDPQPAGPQPCLTAALAQSCRAAHLLEVAPLHGAVLHLSEVHVTKVVCRLPLEGTASVRRSPLPTFPPTCPDRPPAAKAATAALSSHRGQALGSLALKLANPSTQNVSAGTVVTGAWEQPVVKSGPTPQAGGLGFWSHRPAAPASLALASGERQPTLTCSDMGAPLL